MRYSARVAGLAVGAMAWPLVARAATDATNGVAGVLFAVAIGALIAIASIALTQRLRDRRADGAWQQALQASALFCWRADASGRLVEVHPGELARDASASALVGHQLWEIGDSASSLAEIRKAVESGRPFVQQTGPLAAGGASIVLAGTPVRGAAGALVGYVGSVQPGSAPAALPAEASALRADLDARTQQLGDRARELDNAVRELDSFAYSVSHDLRAPLRVVDGFATIVLEDYGDRGKPLDDVGRDHLRRIVAASQRMNSMIDTLLGMSKMTSRELARERVDLSQIARELTDDLRAHDAGRAVDFVVAPNLRVDGDSTLLRLVLQNLLGNAYKFTAKSRDARVEFGAHADGEATAFYVKDNGAGFDMRFAEKMFGLFQRLHSANEFPGTGVGLATVQKIVRRHGGRVWAEAVPAPNDGHGATFYFTLWEKP